MYASSFTLKSIPNQIDSFTFIRNLKYYQNNDIMHKQIGQKNSEY